VHGEGHTRGGHTPGRIRNALELILIGCCADARAAVKLGYQPYAIDGETAIKVVDGEIEAISEGEWRRFDA
jgi:dipeptidase E